LRSGNCEVDFVLARGGTVIAIEVKSSRRKANMPGIDAFSKEFSPSKKFTPAAPVMCDKCLNEKMLRGNPVN
jgi:hypothetical protein